MAYYLKWPASTGNKDTNKSLLQISGITGTMTSVSLKVKENSPALTQTRYFYDVRRQPNTISDGGGVGYLLQEFNTNTTSDGTSGHTINGSSVTVSQFFNNFLADDVLAFNTSIAPSSSCIAIGARFNEVEHFYGLTISEITITDANGAHTINMSDSNGTGTTLTSTDAALTATLFNFPVDDSQWVFYSTGSDTITGTSSHQATTATHSATVERIIAGTSSHTAATATITSIGEREITSSSTHQASAASQTSIGTRTVTATSSHQASTATHSASGIRTITGSAANGAQNASQTASGEPSGQISGSASHQADTASQEATGLREVTATGSHQATVATSTGVILRVITGSATHSANNSDQTSAGSVGNTIAGTASHQASAAASNGTVLRVITGSANTSADNAEQTAAGAVISEITGSANHSANDANVVGIISRTINGLSDHQAATATQRNTVGEAITGDLTKTRAVDISSKYSARNTSPRYRIAI